MTLTIESLGLKQEELLDRMAALIATQLMECGGPEGDTVETAFARTLQKRVMTKIDIAINALAEQHIMPNVRNYVETLCLEETNCWGEKKGTRLTFIEYLVARADAYLREEVNYDGKTRAEAQSSYWQKSGTRIAWMVGKYLQYSIQTAMEQALKTANSAIVGGIEEAVKIKLAEVQESLKISVKVGR